MGRGRWRGGNREGEMGRVDDGEGGNREGEMGRGLMGRGRWGGW